MLQFREDGGFPYQDCEEFVRSPEYQDMARSGDARDFFGIAYQNRPTEFRFNPCDKAKITALLSLLHQESDNRIFRPRKLSEMEKELSANSQQNTVLCMTKEQQDLDEVIKRRFNDLNTKYQNDLTINADNIRTEFVINDREIRVKIWCPICEENNQQHEPFESGKAAARAGKTRWTLASLVRHITNTHTEAGRRKQIPRQRRFRNREENETDSEESSESGGDENE